MELREIQKPLKERYSTVLQTLLRPPPVDVQMSRSAQD
jgi:hypothetical protein